MSDTGYQNIGLSNVLPPDPVFEPGIRRAPDRGLNLSRHEIGVALQNALRYIPTKLHEK